MARAWWYDNHNKEVLTNVLRTNRLKCSYFRKAGKTGHRHMIKLAYVGILAGEIPERAWDEEKQAWNYTLKEYAKFGVMPQKQFYGQRRSFDVLFSSHLFEGLENRQKRRHLTEGFCSEETTYPLTIRPRWTKSPSLGTIHELSKESMSHKALEVPSNNQPSTGTSLHEPQQTEEEFRLSQK